MTLDEFDEIKRRLEKHSAILKDQIQAKKMQRYCMNDISVSSASQLNLEEEPGEWSEHLITGQALSFFFALCFYWIHCEDNHEFMERGGALDVRGDCIRRDDLPSVVVLVWVISSFSSVVKGLLDTFKSIDRAWLAIDFSDHSSQQSPAPASWDEIPLDNPGSVDNAALLERIEMMQNARVESIPAEILCVVSFQIPTIPVRIIDTRTGKQLGNILYDLNALKQWLTQSSTIPLPAVPFDKDMHAVVPDYDAHQLINDFLLRQLDANKEHCKVFLTSSPGR